MNNEIQHVISQWGAPTAISLLAVTVRLLLTSERCTLFGILRGVIVGLFVGISVNLYLVDIPAFGDGTRGAIVGVSAVLAEDLVVALLSVGRKVRTNPRRLLDWLLDR